MKLIGSDMNRLHKIFWDALLCMVFNSNLLIKSESGSKKKKSHKAYCLNQLLISSMVPYRAHLFIFIYLMLLIVRCCMHPYTPISPFYCKCIASVDLHDQQSSHWFQFHQVHVFSGSSRVFLCGKGPDFHKHQLQYLEQSHQAAPDTCQHPNKVTWLLWPFGWNRKNVGKQTTRTEGLTAELGPPPKTHTLWISASPKSRVSKLNEE